MEYMTTKLDAEYASIVVRTLEHTLYNIMGQPDGLVADVEICCDANIEQILSWSSNATGHRPVQSIHMAIQSQCHRQPNHPAISAWDGEMTYTELDRMSSILGNRIKGLGVNGDSFVPLCFEKSKWAVVAVLGVLKAGGAYVFLDPSYPTERLRHICENVSASTVICSPESAGRLGQLVDSVTCISGDYREANGPITIHENCTYLDLQDKRHKFSLNDALEDHDPQSALYAVFTSGSTGEPKGVVVDHAAFFSASQANGLALSLGSRSRVLQFASYIFDVANRDILFPLIFGGTICIPSDVERVNDLAGFISRHHVNCASLTPSVADVIDPSSAPSLEMLILGGEPMSPHHVATWAKKVRLMNAYGVSESAAISALAEIQSERDARNIGVGCGSTLWITDHANPDRLMPIGSVGELLIQGPALARGYLHDESQTSAKFFQHPTWQQRLKSSCQGRIYRTGDLARHNLDGSIEYLGRKDDQVKIHGQRVELAEVEYTLQECLRHLGSPASNVVVTNAATAVLPNGSTNTQLVAFLQKSSDSQQVNGSTESSFPSSNKANDLSVKLLPALSASLPKHMIPARVVVMDSLPYTTSRKVNRRQLQLYASQLFLTKGLIRNLCVECDVDTGLSLSLSSNEQTLQSAWSVALGIPPSQICLEDNFFDLGGDSVAAMRVVGYARQMNQLLSVEQIFNHPILSDMATAICQSPDSDEVATALPITPFSLVKDKEDVVASLQEKMREEFDLVEDVYPCTPMQQGLLALTARDPSAYIARYAWDVPVNIDVQRLRFAWEMTWMANPILRTRFMHTEQGIFQVVLRGDMPWRTIVLPSTDGQSPGARTRVSIEDETLLQLSLVSDMGTDSRPSHRVVLELHHALYDGWSLPLLLEQVEMAYHGGPLPLQPFNNFVKYTLDQNTESCAEFWKSEFAGIQAQNFPPVPLGQSVAAVSSQKKMLARSMEAKDLRSTTYTLSTLLRLAWAVTLCQRTGSRDALFGATVTGRGAPVDGIDRLTGPTLSTVPVRIQHPLGRSIEQAHDQVQDQFLRMMKYEQTGLQRIRKFGDEAATACQFQNLLIIQPIGQDGTPSFGMFQGVHSWKQENLTAFSSYPLTLFCLLGEHSITFKALFDDAIPTKSMERTLSQLTHVCKQLATAPSQSPVSSINVVSPEDLSQLLEWNLHFPQSAHTCVHDLILRRCKDQPDALAICGLEQQITYRQLDEFSSTVAMNLMHRGVSNGHIVPLLFEKSPWIAVTLLATLKAGAAFVLLEPSWPLQRLQEVCVSTSAQIVASSDANAHLGRRICDNVMVVHDSMAKQKVDTSDVKARARSVTPKDPAYAVFTSGSTGKPKGILIHHDAISSSALANSSKMQLAVDSRVFHFASHAFDVSISDNIYTLVAGACLCIPGEEDRKADIVKSANDLRVNWAMLTPSVVNSLLKPDSVPTLRTLLVAGEPLVPSVLQQWAHRVTLINCYGPSECSVYSTIQSSLRQDSDPNDIGIPTAAACWIVDEQNHDRLLPIGAIGELLLEGPNVGTGYLNNPEITAAAFIEPPSWLIKIRGGPPAPLYKTGDLVRYAEDGSLRILGRKDTQVKLNGQRLELGEVEHQITASIPEAAETVAEVIQPQCGNVRPCLVVFVRPHATVDWGVSQTDATSDVEFITQPNDHFYQSVSAIESHLQGNLPRYMIPWVYIPVSVIPLNPSGKTHRRLLQHWISTWPLENFRNYRATRETYTRGRYPATETERIIHSLVSKLLEIAPSAIKMESNFFTLGGDSITAMRLAASARERNLHLTVPDIFLCPVLSDMVEKVGGSHNKRQLMTENGQDTTTLADYKSRFGAHYENLRHHLDFAAPDNIEEVLPLTEVQALVQTEFAPRYLWVPLPSDVDYTRLLRACQRLTHHHPSLRTVFGFSREKELVQVVLRQLNVEFLYCGITEDVAQFCNKDALVTPWRTDGASPLQLQLVTSADSQEYLLIRMSHAQFDGLSLFTICEDLAAGYQGIPLPPAAVFPSHIHHLWVKPKEKAYDTWRSLLKGAQVLDFTRPGLQRSHASATMRSGSHPLHLREKSQNVPRCLPASRLIPHLQPPTNITMATVVKAAWAVVVGRLFTPNASSHSADVDHWEIKDIVFAQLVNGRGLGIVHEDRMVGTSLNYIPVRVRFTSATSSFELLRQVQQQHVDTMFAENMGFEEIRKNCTSWPANTNITSYVRYHSFTATPTCSLDGVPRKTRTYAPSDPLLENPDILVNQIQDGLSVGMDLVTQIYRQEDADFIIDQLCHCIQALCGADRPISNI